MTAPALVVRLLLLSSLTPAVLGQIVPDDPARAFLTATDPLVRERGRRILLGRKEDSLPVFRQALESGNPRVREAAIYSLEDQPQAAIGAWLEQALDDPDPAVQVAALRTLAARGTSVLNPQVLRCAGDRSWALRRAAALLLSRTSDERAIPALARLARDADPDVSRAALQGLLISPERRAAEILIDSYDDREPEHQVRILRRLLGTPDNRELEFFRRLATSEGHQRARILAAAGLARMGEPPQEAPQLEFVLRSACSADPELRNPGVATLLADRAHSGAVLLDALAGPDEYPHEALAELVVSLLGPQAYQPLLKIARGNSGADAGSQAAAIHALRRFRTLATNTDLLWIYSVELPRVVREELCGAFEDLPGSDSARSGLVDLLEDPDSQLRLRAFRVLARYGAATASEIDWLWQRVLEERVEQVQRRMSQLLATHASGAGARRFADQMVELLSKPEPFRGEALAALSNLKDPELSRRVARRILDSEPEPYSLELLRLLTRLRGRPADERIADEFRRALRQGDAGRTLQLLITLRTGGGPRSLAAVRGALLSEQLDLRLEALRTLLTRGDEQALYGLEQIYDELSGEQRIEFLGRIQPGDVTRSTLALGRLLAREQDALVLEAIVARAGEYGLPLAAELAALLTEESTTTFIIRVAEALASIGGELADTTLRRLFRAARAAGDPTEPLSRERQLLIESLARAVARTGQLELAPEIAALLTRRTVQNEHRQNDTEAVFPFEATLMQALLDLAHSSGQPLEVAVALEVELDRASLTGELYLLPKALFVQLARLLEGAPEAFDASQAELLDLALTLPPRAERQELWAATRLADLALAERDHVRAARLLLRAQGMLVDQRAESGKQLRESLGAADPVAGFDPLLRLDARVELARARASRVMGADTEALGHYQLALAAAPFDSWLRLRVGAELIEQEFDPEGARRQVQQAVELNPHDPDLRVRAARILAGGGEAAGFEQARAAHERLRACGLARDTVRDRLGLAESCALLDRPQAAREQIQAAIRIDPEARARVRINPLLREFLDD